MSLFLSLSTFRSQAFSHIFEEKAKFSFKTNLSRINYYIKASFSFVWWGKQKKKSREWSESSWKIADRMWVIGVKEMLRIGLGAATVNRMTRSVECQWYFPRQIWNFPRLASFSAFLVVVILSSVHLSHTHIRSYCLLTAWIFCQARAFLSIHALYAVGSISQL